MPPRRRRVTTRTVTTRSRTNIVAKITKERTKHTGIAVGSALALGWAEKKGTFGKKNEIFGMAPPIAIGLGALLLGIATNADMAKHIATGCLSVGAYELGKGDISFKLGESHMGGYDEDYMEGVDDSDVVEG